MKQLLNTLYVTTQGAYLSREVKNQKSKIRQKSGKKSGTHTLIIRILEQMAQYERNQGQRIYEAGSTRLMPRYYYVNNAFNSSNIRLLLDHA